MKNKLAWFFALVWLLLLTGCAGVPAQQPVTLPTSPSSSEAVPPVEVAQPQQSAEPASIAPEPEAAISGNLAVIALLDRAMTDNASGQREAAGASLERALRIEPRNPRLWQELAQLRLNQGQYAQAITLAHKANSFAGRQPRVLAENWQVIGQARVAQGDSAGAELAFKQATELAQQEK